MTFMIAYARDSGSAAETAAFCSLIGASVSFCHAVGVWRGALALDRWGFAAAIILSSTLGASLRIFGHSVMLLATPALVFGVAFLWVVGSTTLPTLQLRASAPAE